MPDRTYVCVGCGVTGQAGPKGRRPKWCSECRVKFAPDPRVRTRGCGPLPGRSCEACGLEIPALRDKRARFCSGACKEWSRRTSGAPRPLTPTLVCEQCGEQFQPLPKAQYSKTRWCSPKCRNRRNHLARPFGEWRKEDPYPRRPCTCEGCGALFWDHGVGSMAAKCDPCKGEARAQYQRTANKYRNQLMAMASVAGVRFKHVDIFERDAWTCQLCRRPVNPALRHPDQQSPSLDHVLPLSKGGLHVPENVQLAHWICNTRKGNRRTT